jgi:hypothetical protein
VRGQEEHVHVAHVVAEGEPPVDEPERGDERAQAPVATEQPGEAGSGGGHAGHAELLAEIEPPHRQPLGHRPPRDPLHHRRAPVGLGDVEPEVADALTERGARIGDLPEVGGVPGVLRGTGRRADRRNRQSADAEDLPGAARCQHHQQDQGRRQQDRHQVIAERRSVQGEEDRQPRIRGLSGPPGGG